MHFICAPLWALNEIGGCSLVFRPAAVGYPPLDASETTWVANLDTGADSLNDIEMMEQGWSMPIDTKRHGDSTRVRRCVLRRDDGTINATFYTVKCTGALSSLPAETETHTITIFPSVSILNAAPAEVGVRSHVISDQRRGRTGEARVNHQIFLPRFSLMTLLEVPPPDDQTAVYISLSLKGFQGAPWSDKVQLTFARSVRLSSVSQSVPLSLSLSLSLSLPLSFSPSPSLSLSLSLVPISL
eukprot:GHVU01158078.1.p1 GENE.GHVU01158078.1~~GHVU01158078.1.p1  ORF type:complete len:242 (-),score=34.11 GHVU01158078.1:554-1279(-)